MLPSLWCLTIVICFCFNTAKSVSSKMACDSWNHKRHCARCGSKLPLLCAFLCCFFSFVLLRWMWLTARLTPISCTILLHTCQMVTHITCHKHPAQHWQWFVLWLSCAHSLSSQISLSAEQTLPLLQSSPSIPLAATSTLLNPSRNHFFCSESSLNPNNSQCLMMWAC